MIVVTGATGLVGNALLRALGERGLGPVRALVRPGRDLSCLAGLDVEVVRGDTRDLASLVAAFQGADAVIHLAGMIKITREKLGRLREVNVEGTKNVISACRTAGVRRLVYTSSIHAFAEPAKGVCTDETTPIDPRLVFGNYGKTKAEATQLVFAAAREGLDAVIVFPSGIIGPYDWRPSETGQFIVDACRGKIPATVDGGYNFVDSRDVADGLIGALERGRTGEGYILAGHEITVLDLFHELEQLSGTPKPRMHLDIRLVRAVAPLIPAYYWITRQRPLFTTYSLRVISSNCEMSSEKASSELGYSPRPLRQTLGDTVRWFTDQGLVP
jgi:dihydroflavonol-4-reductase